MSDEDIIFDGHSLANEGVTGDLAASAYCGIFLDLNEGAYFCVVTDSASVKIDEFGEFYVLSEFYIIGNTTYSDMISYSNESLTNSIS